MGIPPHAQQVSIAHQPTLTLYQCHIEHQCIPLQYGVQSSRVVCFCRGEECRGSGARLMGVIPMQGEQMVDRRHTHSHTHSTHTYTRHARTQKGR